jgi:glutathione synthase/RimK-type ligase-like ATP-grasp enzyme
VRKVHRVPPFGLDPLGWFEAANAISRAHSIDVLFPTQEQVAVLSACHRALGVATVVPVFSSLRRVQDKISAFRTLQALGIPQPECVVVRNLADLEQVSTLPVFVKRPVSTASSGVRRAASRGELQSVATALGLGACELLVQAESLGRLAMVQAVADNGRLVAHHANFRVREGAGGGAAIKESVDLPSIAEHLEKLLGVLHWHGALSLDVIVTPNGPVVIDVNPRLVEPMNAHFAGVDLVTAMLDLARHAHPPVQLPGRPGVRSRQLLLAILGAAQHHGSRVAILREVFDALRQRGEYAKAKEELTPTSGDPIAAVPIIAAAAFTLVRPRSWRLFHSGAVGPYALTPEGWERILSAAAST